jgi:hypothetical protein
MKTCLSRCTYYIVICGYKIMTFLCENSIIFCRFSDDQATFSSGLTAAADRNNILIMLCEIKIQFIFQAWGNFGGHRK